MTIKYPQYLSTKQITLLRKKYKTVYALAKKINAHQYNLGTAMLQHRMIHRATATRLADSLGIPLEKFESMFDPVL